MITNLYLQTLILLLVFSIFYTTIFLAYFKNINNSIQYIKNDCVIKNVSIFNVTINCLFGNYNYKVELPCLEVLVDTALYKSVKFYRNEKEKLHTQLKNANCSYLPTACQSDPVYIYELLDERKYYLFPPIGFKIECYISENRTSANTTYYDALLNKPDDYLYYFGIVFLVFSYFLCVVMIGHVLISVTYQTIVNKYSMFLLELIVNKNKKDNLKVIRKIVEFFNIDFENLIAKLLKRQLLDENEHNQNQSDDDSSSSSSNSTSTKASIASFSASRMTPHKSKANLRSEVLEINGFSNRIEYNASSANSGSRSISISTNVSAHSVKVSKLKKKTLTKRKLTIA